MLTADTLSCAPSPLNKSGDRTLLAEVTSFVAMVTDYLPATDQRLKENMEKQVDDEICSVIITYCRNG